MRFSRALVSTLVLAGIASTSGQPAMAQVSGSAGSLLFPVESEPGATARHVAARMAGYRALHYCTGIFTGGLSEALLEESLSGRSVGEVETIIDREARTVSVPYAADMEPRIAAWRPGLGCTQLPIGASLDMVQHLPRMPESVRVPDLDARPWPMGDADATAPLPAAQGSAVRAVLDEAFRNQDGVYGGHTWGVVVVKDGRIVAERYAPGWGMHTPSRTNSMCKSIGASLVGVGVQKGLLDLHREPALSAWSTPGDPRGGISLHHLLTMTDGLYTEGGRNPQMELYGSGAPASEVSLFTVVSSRPGTRFVYAGSSTILATMALREAVNDDARWMGYPQQEFLWKVGMTRTVLETDWLGDYLVSGQCWSTARDFGRFGMLYLADGVWNGERILPEGWAEYVSTLGPAQPASHARGGAGYGGQFWIHDGRQGLPEKAYTPNGAAGQYAMIIPSANLVVVRRGFDFSGGFDIARFSADVMRALEE